MRYLEYYCMLEYSWKDKWLNPKGQPKINILPSSEILKDCVVSYSILNRLFHSSETFWNWDKYDIVLKKVFQELKELSHSQLSVEGLILEMNLDYCIPIDHIGNELSTGIPPNWNEITPKKYQKIPTPEIIKLLEDWSKFLKAIEERQNY